MSQRSPGTFGAIVGTAQLFATPAAPQNLYSSAILTSKARLGGLSARIAATASSSTLSIYANWQVSTDGTTYYDCKPMNNAANVAIITGTGTGTTTNVVIDAPSLFGWKYARVRTYTGGATADGANDGVTIDIRYSKE